MVMLLALLPLLPCHCIHNFLGLLIVLLPHIQVYVSALTHLGLGITSRKPLAFEQHGIHSALPQSGNHLGQHFIQLLMRQRAQKFIFLAP